MFSGIVHTLGEIVRVDRQDDVMRYAVRLLTPPERELRLGASFSIDGVCQTIVKIEGGFVYFEAVKETLRCTTFSGYELGRVVNGEYSLRVGDEIGGHLLSGHVFGVAGVAGIKRGVYHEMKVRCPGHWMKYLFTKGYIAVDGVSLTITAIEQGGYFSVHLIPETLKRTTLGRKEEGDLVNIEIDSQTQAIVDTVERFRD
ncbi:MAG: riboflavin synthase subunit alpha [Waddliaceae bacterium]